MDDDPAFSLVSAVECGSLFRRLCSVLLSRLFEFSSPFPFRRDEEEEASPPVEAKTEKRSALVVIAFAWDILSRTSTIEVSSCAE